MAIITLNNNSLSSVTALPAGVGGKVLQVVQAKKNSTTNISGDGAIGLSQSITPSSSSNKILVMVNLDGVTLNTDNDYGQFELKLSNGTKLRDFAYPYGWNSNDNGVGTTPSMTWLHEPNTTSQLTYEVHFNSISGTVEVSVNRDEYDQASTLTLMEIAG